MAVAVVLVNGLKRLKHKREAEEAKNQEPRGKSFAGYDQKMNDIDDDDR